MKVKPKYVKMMALPLSARALTAQKMKLCNQILHEKLHFLCSDRCFRVSMPGLFLEILTL